MGKVIIKTLDDLIKGCNYLAPDDIEIITKAYFFAEQAHANQYRQTGELYINHPLNVALILTEIFADKETIIAALLHDTIEDTDANQETIIELFGNDVANIVSSLTKINKINFSTKSDAIIANHQKILVGLVEDVRVIIIKFADRLHNLETLWVKNPDKQKATAKETLEIFAPIANRLGIHVLKSRLEDLSLRYYKPEAYYDIVEKLNKTKSEREQVIANMKEDISKLLNNYNIHHDIRGRSKNIYSIYKKITSKGKTFNDIYDFNALRIYVDSENDCYLALGAIHAKYKPLPKRFKDYIAMPKSNMYQSLHTTVIGNDGLFFEIQIRTYQMDKIAEYGLASYGTYKEEIYSHRKMQDNLESKLNLFRSIIELKEDTIGAEDFVNAVKYDILSDSIFVYTPKGDVVDISIGATPLDFAYKIHSEVGHKTVSVLVNNKIVPLNHELQNGDVIKVNTSNNQKPSKTWLDIVKTTHAKNKIKAYFNRLEKIDNAKVGEDAFKEEIKKRKLILNEILSSKELHNFLNENKIFDLQELYCLIGANRFTSNYVLNQITKPEISKEDHILDKLSHQKEVVNNLTDQIIVKGIDHIKLNIAACCRPVKGDEIIGYITKGYGITVHRTICNNLIDLEDRLIAVEWNDNVSNKYATNILVTTHKDSQNLVAIINEINALNNIVQSINTITNQQYTIYDIIILVTTVEELNKIIIKINQINDVVKAERIIK